MADPVAARRVERTELLATAAAYVERLQAGLELVAAAVAGSVARGDFNVWSDIDVVVVARGLPERAVDRAGLLLEDAPARVQPVGYTPDEFTAAVRRGDRLAREAQDRGVVLLGEEFFGRAQQPPPTHFSPPSGVLYGPSVMPLPGGDLIERGIRDLEREVESIEALIVSIGAPRLRRLGLPVARPIAMAEHRLYEVLSDRHGDAAHSRYNALVRRLVSFERAAAGTGLGHA